LSLKSGVATLCDGCLQVRPAKKLEQMNAIMHLACKKGEGSERGAIEKNQRVKIRLVGPLVAVNRSKE
ncbi:MAG: hypothetical protein D3925_08680, partial [Candidatus Electrothrix sp. AR5]|nr:hypothetical protein [Candidatus Electrothrix sp. AR5]